MTDKPITPQDVLPDGQDFKLINGIQVRKGTIFAAMQNMSVLDAGTEQKQTTALAMIRELAPGLVALGVHKHFQCRNPQVEAILTETAETLGL